MFYPRRNRLEVTILSLSLLRIGNIFMGSCDKIVVVTVKAQCMHST